MILSAIAAMSKNRVIGHQGGLPWNLPEDMKFFRETTKGHVMIMGRKTFDSFGGKPLPGRPHIVISRNADFHFSHPQVIIVNHMAEAFKKAEKLIASDSSLGEEVFVIGGGEIYRQSMDYLHRIYLTEIEKEFSGDARFPDFDFQTFKLKKSWAGQGPIAYQFNIYERLGSPISPL